MKKEPGFFDFAAEVGLTKHLGGLEATRELLDYCKIARGHTILDVGCGAGATPAFIGKEYGCHVFGVDINDRMVDRANETAAREGVSDLVECHIGDAQKLTFEDNTFDIVFTESNKLDDIVTTVMMTRAIETMDTSTVSMATKSQK